MGKNRYIVITTINAPTEAILGFARRRDEYSLIVIGDVKTPEEWSLVGADFHGHASQASLGFSLPESLPDNHYSRKMIGYLVAIRAGAKSIIDTDDDNIPKPNFGFPDFEGQFEEVSSEELFVNPYSLFTDLRIWPRGLPLGSVLSARPVIEGLSTANRSIGIWQGLADGDPDVDAVYRLTVGVPCVFSERAPVLLRKGVVAPFNSQNTVFSEDVFALMYLPTTVSFRFTDILRSYVALPIMWGLGFYLGFTQATVFQERNHHDLMEDFRSELPMYLDAEKCIDLVSKAVSSSHSLEENLVFAYEALAEEGIVGEKELRTLSLWLQDLKDLSLP